MSFVRLLADGASEAVSLIPLLFVLGVAPAHAQLPRTALAQAVEQAVGQAAKPPTQPVLAPVAGAALPALVAQHMVLELADGEARLRLTSVFRNDTDAPIAAHYLLPLGSAVTLRGVDDDPANEETFDAAATDATFGASHHDCGGDADGALQAVNAEDGKQADAAEFIEAGETDPRTHHSGVLWLEPGDEITLVSTRPADVFRRDTRRRVVIALPPAPAGLPAPQFSAEIDVDAPQPIVALGSATHGGEVDGLGGSRARLFIPNGKVYEARFLSVDLELGAVAHAVGGRWGNEDRLPIAAR